MNIQELFQSLSHLNELRNNLRVDRYKYVCAADGINERKSMKMYDHFRMLADGRIPYIDNKPASIEYLQQIVDMAERAKAEYCHNVYLRADLTNFDYNHRGNDFEHALYLFDKQGEKRVEEFNLSDADTYTSVALLLKDGWKLREIIRQCDETSSTQRYLNYTEEERRQTKRLRIYDGDVFEVMIGDSMFDYSSDCGMYLCHNGAYRKLVYIPGKGYVNKSKPLIDEDAIEISIDKDGLFNSHKLTWDSFRKVGNIHVDLGCLMEKKTTEN